MIVRARQTGVTPVLLTGDHKNAARHMAEKQGITQWKAGCLPEDKLVYIEESQKNGCMVCMIGDGVNDAPVLSRADIGIAMGGLGSDAAIEAADIVLMDDAPSKISTAIRISKKTLRIVRQNIIIALGIKGLFLLLGAFGMANMWEAVFADVGVAVIAILNAARALNVKEFQ